MKFVTPLSVEIKESRWSVEIIITTTDGMEHTYVASADSYYTEHDHIWFGTPQEMADFEKANLVE